MNRPRSQGKSYSIFGTEIAEAASETVQVPTCAGVREKRRFTRSCRFVRVFSKTTKKRDPSGSREILVSIFGISPVYKENAGSRSLQKGFLMGVFPVYKENATLGRRIGCACDAARSLRVLGRGSRCPVCKENATLGRRAGSSECAGRGSVFFFGLDDRK